MERRSRPEASPSSNWLDNPCRRVDFPTKLASVRAPIVSWMINGNPLRMCDPEVQCSRTRPCFLNRRASKIGKASIQTDRLAEFTYRFIILIRSPRRIDGRSFVGTKSAFDRRIAPHSQTTISRNPLPPRFLNRPRRGVELPAIHTSFVSHTAHPVSLLYERFSR